MHYQFEFGFLADTWPILLEGMWATLVLSASATVLGFVLGTLCAVAGSQGPHWLRKIVGAYVETIRNTPLLVQIFIVYFGLASIGWKIPAMIAAVVALVINIGAYTCEIVRAGIESVQPGQIEAGECLGLSPMQVIWHIVLRPAVERVYPSLTSQYVLLMLASSITSQISAEELTSIANRIQSDTFRSFEVYLIVAALYLILSVVIRAALWLIGQIIFTRRRRLGTPL